MDFPFKTVYSIFWVSVPSGLTRAPVCIDFFPKDPKTDNECRSSRKRHSHGSFTHSDNAVPLIAMVMNLDLYKSHILQHTTVTQIHTSCLCIFIFSQPHTRPTTKAFLSLRTWKITPHLLLCESTSTHTHTRTLYMPESVQQ